MPVPSPELMSMQVLLQGGAPVVNYLQHDDGVTTIFEDDGVTPITV